jgi:hypothetical protein
MSLGHREGSCPRRATRILTGRSQRSGFEHASTTWTETFESMRGSRLNPRKADLHRWREVSAEKLRGWGIEAEATRQATRGATRNHPDPWRAKAAADGRRMKPRNDDRRGAAAATSRADARRAWQAIAAALAQSGDAADRKLASAVDRSSREMVPPGEREPMSQAHQLSSSHTVGERRPPSGRDRESRIALLCERSIRTELGRLCSWVERRHPPRPATRQHSSRATAALTERTVGAARMASAAQMTAHHVNLLLPYIGGLPMRDVCNEALEGFKAARVGEGAKNATINRSLEVVRTVAECNGATLRRQRDPREFGPDMNHE